MNLATTTKNSNNALHTEGDSTPTQSSRRSFFQSVAGATGVAATTLASASGAALALSAGSAQAASETPIVASEHWAIKKVGSQETFHLEQEIKQLQKSPNDGNHFVCSRFLHGWLPCI